MPRALVFLTICVSLFLLSCGGGGGGGGSSPSNVNAGLADSAWPKFRGKAMNNARSVGSGATGAQKWTFLTGDNVQSSPAIGADGTVYVGSRDNKVYALDGATGAKKWEFLTGGFVESSPAVGADGTVYVGSFDGKVYAIE